MISQFVHRIHAFYDRKLLRVPPRATNPYLTHIPVLLSLPSWIRVRNVLEFGCGDFSTRTFLDRQYYPELQRIDSYENDSTWATHIRQQFGGDARLSVRFVDGAICDTVHSLNLEQYDLVFIDDSATGEERSATIRAVALQCPKRAIVVVHDFEYYPYRRASAAFRHRFRFTSLNPNTGLLWNDGPLAKSVMGRLNRVLRNSGEITNTDEWAETLRTANQSVV